MAQGIDEAQRQRELTKHALARSAAELEQRVRRELDWRTRLRTEGPRIAAIGAGAVIVIGALVFVRSKLRRGDDDAEPEPASLEDVTAELRALRDEMKKAGGETALWQKALMRGLAAAGAAGGTYAAKRMLDRAPTDEGAQRS